MIAVVVLSWLGLCFWLTFHMYRWFWDRIVWFKKPLPMLTWVLFAFACGSAFFEQMGRFMKAALIYAGYFP